MTTLNDAVAVVDAAMRANIPTLLWGGPGIGKTAAIAAAAHERGAHLETVIASIREPSDFGGLPIVTNDGPTPGAYLAPPRWARDIVDRDQPTWVFLDELSTAAPATQAALLRVVCESVVGELALPDTTRFVAAANPTSTAAGGWDLTHLARPELIVAALDGLVGPAATTSYISWAETIDLPAASDIVADPTVVDWANIDAANCYVALHGVAAWSHTNPDRWADAFAVCDTALDAGRDDIVAATARTLLAAKPDSQTTPAGTLARLAPLLRRAGTLQ